MNNTFLSKLKKKERNERLSDLYNMSNWLLWRYEPNEDGKITKVPYGIKDGKARKATGKKTSPEYLSYCRTYDEVLAYAEQHPSEAFDGVGIQLPPGYVGTDDDKCIEADFYRKHHVYAERSPSGTGSRSIIKGCKPGRLSRKNSHEIYDNTGNFLTYTGDVISDYPITENQEAINQYYYKFIDPPKKDDTGQTVNQPTESGSSADSLSAYEILQLIQSGKDSKLTEYFNTPIGGCEDDSALDQGLCNKLAFYSAKNPQVINTVFRASKRLRDKWDEKHTADGRTYGEMTIQKAIDGCAEVFDKNKYKNSSDDTVQPSEGSENGSDSEDDDFEAVDAYDELVRYESVVRKIIIEDILKDKQIMLYSGDSKSGKSHAMLNLAICIATGGQWLGKQCAQGKVLYLNLEVSPEDFVERLDAILERMSIPKGQIQGVLKIFHGRGNAFIANAKTTGEIIKKIEKMVLKEDYSVIFIDPFYIINKANENDNTAITQTLLQFGVIAESCNVSIIIPHHFAKGYAGDKKQIDRNSGAGTLARFPDSILTMTGLTIDKYFRLEGTLRSFKQLDPINVRFEHPLYIVDNSEEVKKAGYEASDPNQKRKAEVRAKDSAINKDLASMAKEYPDGFTFNDFKDEYGPNHSMGQSSLRKYFTDNCKCIREQRGRIPALYLYPK